MSSTSMGSNKQTQTRRKTEVVERHPERPRPLHLLLADILDSMTAKERIAFASRLIVSDDRPSLHKIGTKMGYTGERVRQFAALGHQKFQHGLRCDEGSAIKERAATFGDQFGRVINRRTAYTATKKLLGIPAGRTLPEACLDMFLVLAEFDHAWRGYVLRGDPTLLDEKIYEKCEEAPGGTDEITWIRNLAADLDAPEGFVSERMEVISYRWTCDRIVPTSLTIPARIAIALEYVGQAMTVDEICEVAEIPNESKISAKNALGKNEAFVRVGVNKYALASWKPRPFASMAEEIKRAIRTGRGRASYAKMLEEFPERFNVRLSSLKTAIAHRAFRTSEDGFTRLRQS